MTVVEGVENHLQLQAVRKLGCDFVQGYLFATPGSGSEITTLLRNTTDRDWTLVRKHQSPEATRHDTAALTDTPASG